MLPIDHPAQQAAIANAGSPESLRVSAQYHLRSDPTGLRILVDRELVRIGRLRAFIKLAWHTVEGTTPYSTNWHIDAICDHLEAVSAGDIKRLIIAVPPRSMKSVSTAVMWPAWDWIENPQRRTLFSSYAHNLSKRDSARCRRVIMSPWYQQRWGNQFKLTSDQNAKHRFENDKTGFRLATSVGGQLTGEGADFVVVDDPLNASDAESIAKRESCLTWWNESMSTRLNDPANGAFVVIQQRLHENDVVGDVIKRHGLVQDDGEYVYLCLPSEYDPEHPHRWFRDPRKEAGELLWPSHVPSKVLDSLKRALGPYACTPAESPVLMADLSMKPISEVRAGEQVIGFEKPALLVDDPRSYRRHHLVQATVKAVHRYPDVPIVRMTLDSGRAIRCTPDHKWFRRDKGADRPMYLPAQLGTELARVCPPALSSKFIQQRERVVSIEPDGAEDVFALETTSGNYVVWGLASSNSAGQLQQLPAPREGGLFKRSWFKLVQVLPADMEWARGWDLAATEKQAIKSDPDYTATVLVGWSRSQKRWYVADAQRWREDPAAIEQIVKSVAEADVRAGRLHVKIELPQDPGQAGKSQSRAFIQMLAGHDVRALIQSGDKVVRSNPFASQAAGGFISVLDADWTDDFLKEFTSFPTGGHDDWVDATSSAFTRLTGGTTGLIEHYARMADERQKEDAEKAALLAAHGGTMPGLTMHTDETTDMGWAFSTIPNSPKD